MFRFKEDRLPVTLFAGFFLLDAVVYVAIDNVWLLVAWMLLGIVPKGFVCAWNHHHQHCYTFKTWLPNRLLEMIYFLQTGACGYGWELHHVVGHHVSYMDQAQDPSRWKTSSGRSMGEIEYAVKTAITSYPRGIAVGFGHRRLLFRGLTSLFVSIAVIATLVYCRPVSGLLVFLLPSMISLLITAWATHSHHSDLETDDPYAASRNIIDPIYNRLTGNLGYHTAHHERCGLHWSRLPELHDRIRDRIPDSCYYVPGGALGFLRDTFDTKATEISTNSSQGIKG